MLSQLKKNKVALVGGLVFVALVVFLGMKYFPGPQAKVEAPAPAVVEEPAKK